MLSALGGLILDIAGGLLLYDVFGVIVVVAILVVFYLWLSHWDNNKKRSRYAEVNNEQSSSEPKKAEKSKSSKGEKILYLAIIAFIAFVIFNNWNKENWSVVTKSNYLDGSEASYIDYSAKFNDFASCVSHVTSMEKYDFQDYYCGESCHSETSGMVTCKEFIQI